MKCPFMGYYELLYLAEVRRVSFFVDTARFEPAPTHSPASASDQNHLVVFINVLGVNVTLDKRDAPVVGDLLSKKPLEQIVVPHVPSVHFLLKTELLLIQELSQLALLFVGVQLGPLLRI